MNELFRALPALLKEFDDNEALRQAIAFAAWRKIAGDALRDRAVPIRLYKKHLIVAVTSETWKKHLEHLSGQMIFKINSVLGSAVVTFIEFRVDEATVTDTKAKHQTPIADKNVEANALSEVTPKLRVSADAIKDDHLRYQFLLAAGSCLARKNKLNQKKMLESD